MIPLCEQKQKVEELNINNMLKNGWVIHGNSVCQIFKENGIVHIQLCVKDGTTPNILTLPEGWRPEKNLFFPASVQDGNVGGLYGCAYPNGDVSISSVNAGKLTFINFSYKVD